MPSRRRTLAVAGTTVGIALAGCLDELSTSDDDGTASTGDAALPSDAVSNEPTVNYPAFVDDDVDVLDADGRIEYADPETTFAFAALVDGEDAAGNDLRFSRTLADGTRAAFIAPAADGESFTYHVFANEAFVSDADWYVLIIDGESADARQVDFDDPQDGVYYTAVTPDRAVDGVAIADAPIESVDVVDDVTIVGLERTEAYGPKQAIPEVVFDFEYTPADERVEITHTGGDDVVNENLVITFEDDRVERPFDEETVSAGDRTTINDVPADSEVLVIHESGGTSALLASFEPN